MRTLLMTLLVYSAIIHTAQAQPDRVDAALPTTVIGMAFSSSGASISVAHDLFVRNSESAAYTIVAGSGYSLSEDDGHRIIGIALDTDDVNAYIGVDDGFGLLRFSTFSQERINVTPPEAGRALSAIAVSPLSGGLYCGTGGLPTIHKQIDARGLFFSSDHGTSWELLPPPGDVGGAWGGVAHIAFDRSGSLFISCKGYSSTTRSGVYRQNSDGSWQQITTENPSRFMVCDGRLYHVPGQGLIRVIDVGDSLSIGGRLLRINPGLTDLLPFRGDTLVAVSKGYEDTGYIAYIINNESVIDSVQILGSWRNTVDRRWWIDTNAIEPILYSAGAGAVHELTLSATETPLQFEPTQPIVLESRFYSSSAVVNVQEHGWLSVSSDGSVMSLKNVPKGARVTNDNSVTGWPLILWTSTSVYQVEGDSAVDLVPSDRFDSNEFIRVVSRASDGRVFIVTNTRLLSTDTSGTVDEVYAQTGWPQSSMGSILACSWLSSVNGMIVAWADGNIRPEDVHKLGGLYSYDGTEWHRVDTEYFDDRTILKDVSVLGPTIAVSSLRSAFGGQTTAPCVNRWDASNWGSDLVATDANTTPTTGTVAILENSAVLWETIYRDGYVFHEDQIYPFDLVDNIQSAAALADGDYFCTAYDGIVRIQSLLSIVSVDDVDQPSNVVVSGNVAPNPGNGQVRLHLSGLGGTESVNPLTVTIFSSYGLEINSVHATRTGEAEWTIDTSVLMPGAYYFSVDGAKLSASIPFIVCR